MAADRRIVFSTSAALERERRTVATRYLYLIQQDAPFEIAFSAEGDSLPIARALPAMQKCRGFQDIYVTLDAADVVDGGEIVFFASEDLELDINPKGDAAASASERIITEVTDNNGTSLLDQVTGLASGAGGSKFAVSNITMAQQHATKFFQAWKLGTSAAQSASLQLHMPVPLQTLFSPSIVGRNLGLFEGRRWIFEGDVYCERTYTPTASEIQHSIAVEGTSGAAFQPGMGLYCRKDSTTWHFMVTDALNPGERAPLIDVDTGIACLDAYTRFRLVVGVESGEAFMDCYVNGELAHSHVGDWPSDLFGTLKALTYNPRLRVYRQAAAPDDARMFGGIYGPVYVKGVSA